MTDLTNDLQVLSATIYGEARGEPLEGKQAVACVVLNRVAQSAGRRQFGDGTIAGACLAPWQFSCWNENDPNRAVLLGIDFENPNDVLQSCIDVANAAMAGQLADPTNGALFYKVTSLPWPADWGLEVPPVATIGHQSFYVLS